MLLLFQQAEENKADPPWRLFLYGSRLHLIVLIASIRTLNLTSSGPPEVTGMETVPSSSSPVMDINPPSVSLSRVRLFPPYGPHNSPHGNGEGSHPFLGSPDWSRGGRDLLTSTCCRQ